MFIAKVVGNVISSHKTENMNGLPLRIVQQFSPDNTPTENYLIAVDVLNADTGEMVLVTTGSSARQTHLTDAHPCDAVIMAIVDTWQTEGQTRYNKGPNP